ncbi:MAG TPA: hypothetical protein VIS10_04160 [Anaerolineales bacterium]
MNIKKVLIILAHAFIGWALCTASMGISQATTTIENALIIHAVGAPIFFTVVSLNYFKRFNFTTPLMTALIFVGFVIFMDFFLVAMLVLKSFEMFTSMLGTWIPFALIFTSTYVTGLLTVRSPKQLMV